ncbi:MAG: hypothetical protein BWX80_01499 [Candidatus Hydrogenedentes bacterium ADurb.Bin101]|nr:MAG: hypothetical protein BWX80_01499 [Candidatus Hydrogenedentes bacterium ADurb.Bin101]
MTYNGLPVSTGSQHFDFLNGFPVPSQIADDGKFFYSGMFFQAAT